MDSPTDPPATARAFGRLARGLIAATALLYAWLIYKHGSPFAAGSDSSGYLNSARLLGGGEFTAPLREIPGYQPPWRDAAHVPLGFIRKGEDRIVPTYPIGLPLHLAAVAPVVGWEKTARVVNALNVLAAGALLFLFCRQLGLGPGWALAGVGALWLSPLWRLFALQPMSDALAVTWTLAALLGAWRSRQAWPWGVVAGGALGMAVLVRPTNVVLALPLAIALGGNVRAWLACGVGGLPFAAALFYYNAYAYGHPLTTGYGPIGPGFEMRVVPHNLAHFSLWLPLLAGAPLALAALALPWIGKRTSAIPSRAIWLLAFWVLCFVAFYASYWCAGETWWYLRFLLPALPAVIIGGLLALQQLATRAGTWRWGALVLVLIGLGSQQVLSTQLLNYSVRDGERRYYRACLWLNENLPANAIVATCQLSGAQFYYTRFPLVRWDQVSVEDMEKIVQGLAAAQRPFYAALFDFEEERAMKSVFSPARWTKLHVVDGVAIWRLASPDVSTAAEPRAAPREE